jgi:hypothetical protein
MAQKGKARRTANRRCTAKAGSGMTITVAAVRAPLASHAATKLIPVELLDASVDAAMSARQGPHYIEAWVGGNGNAAKLEEINKEIMAATRDQRYAELAELSAKAAEIVTVTFCQEGS